MINSIKEWINSLLCLGIFTTLVELILPKGNIKKYIYVIIGIITVMTIISPLISKQDYEAMAKDAVETIAKEAKNAENASHIKINEEEYMNYQKEMVKNEYINNLKKTMWNDIISEGAVLDSIDIYMDDNYSITSLKIVVKEYGSKEYKNKMEILQYIKKYYDIDTKYVEIEESK